MRIRRYISDSETGRSLMYCSHLCHLLTTVLWCGCFAANMHITCTTVSHITGLPADLENLEKPGNQKGDLENLEKGCNLPTNRENSHKNLEKMFSVSTVVQ